MQTFETENTGFEENNQHITIVKCFVLRQQFMSC